MINWLLRNSIKIIGYGALFFYFSSNKQFNHMKQSLSITQDSRPYKNHRSLPMISCFYTRKSKIPSVTPLSILNSFELSSLTKIPCLIDSLISVYLISMYCLKVILNRWHNSSYYFVRKVVFFSFFYTGMSFLAALRVVPFIL